ncbi:arylsulfatase I-like [Saccoglossus kowalevskii]
MLARSGVRLNNYYVASHCVPSRNMLMSGRHVIDIGLQHGEIKQYPRGLPLDEITIADKLKEAGYATHLIGKWHCGCYSKYSLPHNRGFDTFFGYLGASDDHYTHMVRGLSDLRLNDDCVGYKYFGDFSTIMYANEAKNIIAQHDQNKERTVFLPVGCYHMTQPKSITHTSITIKKDAFLSDYILDLNQRFSDGRAVSMHGQPQ